METPDRHIHPHDAADSAPHVSPIWQATIDKYYEELRREGVKAPAVDQDLWSIHTPDDLLQQIQPLTPQGSTPPANWMWSLRRLKSIILNINDFVAVIKLVLGMNGQVATIIWGSIRLILKVSPTRTASRCRTSAKSFSLRNRSSQRSWICSKS